MFINPIWLKGAVKGLLQAKFLAPYWHLIGTLGALGRLVFRDFLPAPTYPTTDRSERSKPLHGDLKQTKADLLEERK